MNLKNIIKNKLREYLTEQKSNDSIKNTIITRVPFLKDYKIFKNHKDENRLETQKIVYNENVKVMMNNEILLFPQYNISSEVIYYPHTINDITFHNFIVKNEFHTSQPKDMDDLTFKVFLIAKNLLEKNLSYSKELRLKSNEQIPVVELNQIINDVNGTLFKLEEYTEKHNLNF